jgi:tetratricopeptide (TPR) repeat protein
MEEQDYLQFEAYLENKLSEDALRSFEERLNSDVEFNNAFNIYQDLASHLKHDIANEQENSDFKANLDVISNMYFNKLEDKQLEILAPQKSNFYKYATAASVALLMGIFIFSHFQNPSYSDYNTFDPISLTVRNTSNEAVKIAEETFNSQNYKEAIVAFNTLLETNNSNIELQLYKGIALVETNQYQEARSLLIKISEGNSAYKNKAKWILALSYLKQENRSECITILKSIPQEAEDYKQAQKLLNKLD